MNMVYYITTVVKIHVLYLLHNRNTLLQINNYAKSQEITKMTRIRLIISTTNLAACVCVRAKCDQFLPARFYFESKRPENVVRIAKFPYAAFGLLFAFHCPLFFTRKDDLECKSSHFAVVVSPHCGR